MPVYEYRCLACGEVTEAIQPMGQAVPPGACAACGGALKRAYSRVGVVFQGWGFNRTDALIDDRRGPRKDFKTLKAKAEEIAEG
jgi:putative FmdB family regulatory protein